MGKETEEDFVRTSEEKNPQKDWFASYWNRSLLGSDFRETKDIRPQIRSLHVTACTLIIVFKLDCPLPSTALPRVPYVHKKL